MRLTCPTCRSVLEVPDGTSALVRCPTCRGVFDPAANSSPPPPPPPVRKSARTIPPAERPEQESERAKAYPVTMLDLEAKLEKERVKLKALKRQLRSAGVGCKLLRYSYMCYIASLIWMLAFMLAGRAVMTEPIMPIMAGLLGFGNFILGAVAMGFIVAGPNQNQIRVYGIISLVVACAHLMLLMALVAQPSQVPGRPRLLSLFGVPSAIPFLSNYVTFMVYPQFKVLFDILGFPIVLMVAAGLMEVFRIMFSMITLMCLARTAGDDYLGYRCLRAAASPLFLFGWMFIGMLGGFTAVIETGAYRSDFGTAVIGILIVSMWAFLALMVLVPMRRTGEVMDLCMDPIFVDEKYRKN